MESRGLSSPVLRGVFGLNMVFHPAMFVIVWKRLLAPRQSSLRISLAILACLANTDELTQLANRRRVAEVIESELQRFARYGHVFSIVLIDVDRFKAVNDRFGHSVGDKTLVALAPRIMTVLRDVDTLGRWGGEEFVVILAGTPFEETLHKAAAAI